MNHPLVSIIIPVYNEEVNIERCIESLLAQDYPKEHYEIIIINNNSTDGTVNVVRQYPVILLEETTQGPGAARNRGLTCARGEIVAFTDADCFAETQWLREMVRPFSDPTVGGVGGAIEGASRDTAVERYSDERKVINHRFHDPPFLPYLVPANAAFRKGLLDAVGGFDESFVKAGEDIDLSWRIQLDAPCTFVFAGKAVVYHKHRHTVFGLLAQSFRYHSPIHKFHTKFSQYESYPKWGVRQTIIFYWALLCVIPAWFGVRILKWIVGRRSRHEMLYPFFEWIWRLGEATGRLRYYLLHRHYRL